MIRTRTLIAAIAALSAAQTAYAIGPDTNTALVTRLSIDLGIDDELRTYSAENAPTFQAAVAGQIVVVMLPHLANNGSSLSELLLPSVSAENLASGDRARTTGEFVCVRDLQAAQDPASLGDIDSTLEIQTGTTTASNR